MIGKVAFCADMPLRNYSLTHFLSAVSVNRFTIGKPHRCGWQNNRLRQRMYRCTWQLLTIPTLQRVQDM